MTRSPDPVPSRLVLARLCLLGSPDSASEKAWGGYLKLWPPDGLPDKGLFVSSSNYTQR